MYWTAPQEWLTVYTEVDDNDDVFISGLEFYTVEDVKISEGTKTYFYPQNTLQFHRTDFKVKGTKCEKERKPCPYICCPVNCTVTRIPDPKCNKTCGGGWKQNYIIIRDKKCDGEACPKNQWEECNTEACTSVAGLFGGGKFLKSKMIFQDFLSGFVILLVTVGGGGAFFFIKNRQKNASPVPIDHIVLEKNDKLKETIHALTEESTELYREFEQLVLKVNDWVQGSIASSQKDINKKHNRWVDVG